MTQYVTIEEFNSLKSAHEDTVELLANAMKRITQLEIALFSHDSEGELVKDENDKPVISSSLSSTPEKPVETILSDIDIIPQTATEHRACELVEHLRSKVKSGKEEVFLTSRDIMNLLKNGIKDEYRVKNDVTNIRQIKKDVIEKAKKLFPANILLSKKTNGHKEVRIIFRQLS